MASNKTAAGMLCLIVLATVIDGLLSGGNVDRAIVAMPAWRQVGPLGWADFSRHADLGNGQFFYPAMAIGGTIISVAAAVLLKWTGRPYRDTAPIVIAAGLMVAALPISFKAAPYMVSLHHISNNDGPGLMRAFLGFEYWGRLQGSFHVAAFCANLWSLVTFSRDNGAQDRP